MPRINCRNVNFSYGCYIVCLTTAQGEIVIFFNKTVKMLFFMGLMSIVPHKQSGPVIYEVSQAACFLDGRI